MAQKIDLNLVEQINKTTGELEGFKVEVRIDNENNSSKIVNNSSKLTKLGE